MTLKSEVAELRYEVAELSSSELRLTFTTGVEYTYGTPMSVLPSFAEHKR